MNSISSHQLIIDELLIFFRNISKLKKTDLNGEEAGKFFLLFSLTNSTLFNRLLAKGVYLNLPDLYSNQPQSARRSNFFIIHKH